MFPANSNRAIHAYRDSTLELGSSSNYLYFDVPYQLEFGDSVTLPGMNWVSGRTTLQSFDLGSPVPSHVFYPWDSSGSVPGAGYLGLRITEPNHTCIGWLHCDSDGIIYGFASNCNTFTGLEDPIAEDRIKIGPNPSTGTFELRFTPPEHG